MEAISIDEFKGNTGTEKYQTIVVDRHHFIRQVYWAPENVRKNVQKSMSKTLRRYYKRIRYIITTRKSNLSDENKAVLNLMLEYSEDLSKAQFIKEFNAAITAFRNNYKCILNSLKYRHISNGPTEWFNNKIKVLKRISYGMHNFTYFMNKILMSTD